MKLIGQSELSATSASSDADQSEPRAAMTPPASKASVSAETILLAEEDVLAGRHPDARKATYDLGLERASPSVFRRFLRGAVHFLAYNFILKRGGTRTMSAAGFRLALRPTVFHPKLFLTSEFFANFIAKLDLSGKRVADIGTGSGILALAAARAGARQVVALDINPAAAEATAGNARANGLGERVTAVCSNLMSALPTGPLFDVILSNPPFFPGEPRDIADRAWCAGPGYRDIVLLFEQARQRLTPTGRMYVLFSSDSDLYLLGRLIAQAGFRARRIADRSILIEALIIYELRPE